MRAPLVVTQLPFASLAFVFALGGSACAETPARSFEKFYDALAQGDDEAIERLSARARATLDDESRRALLSTPPRASVRDVRVLSQDEQRASLEVTDALGDTDRVSMVREDGAWKVDL